MVELAVKNRAPWWYTDPQKLEELKAALRAHAPRMRLHIGNEQLVARGSFGLVNEGQTLDSFAIEIRYDRDNPIAEPKVKEVGNAIERLEDNHINVADGTCCLGVYGEWEARTNDTSFSGFLTGPVRNFFISQAIFKRTKVWIFDQRKHGIDGMVEAYGELLGEPVPTLRSVGSTLSFLSLPSHKGHWLCPCASGGRYRECCRTRLTPSPLPADIAAKLFKTLQREVAKVQGQEASAVLVYLKQ